MTEHSPHLLIAGGRRVDRVRAITDEPLDQMASCHERLQRVSREYGGHLLRESGDAVIAASPFRSHQLPEREVRQSRRVALASIGVMQDDQRQLPADVIVVTFLG